MMSSGNGVVVALPMITRSWRNLSRVRSSRIGPGGKPCRALALGFGADDIHVHQSLTDAILNTMERVDVEPLRQPGKQRAQGFRHLIERPRGRGDDLRMGARRQQQE